MLRATRAFLPFSSRRALVSPSAPVPPLHLRSPIHSTGTMHAPPTNGNVNGNGVHINADFAAEHTARGVSRLVNGVIVKGEGSYVTFDDGRKMLDFTTGIGVTGLGHCHPVVSKAAADQCMNLVHGQCSIAFHEPGVKLISALMPLMPDPSLDTFFFWNSGSEAVEAAVKLARTATGRQNIISMQGGYHGRTFGAMALTRSKTIYSDRVSPLMPGVYVTPYPYWHQLGLPPNATEEQAVAQSIHQLNLLFAQQTNPAETAAIIIEPVLGEGGYIAAPASYLKALREICDEHGILLIFDEVQCGFGRTGKYFASEYSGVRPDVMIIAKGLANGFPLSGIVSRKELMDTQKPGSMASHISDMDGGTYAGNAIACAAAVACTKVMRDENVLENVNARSAELFDGINVLRANPKIAPYILDVRGKGLMVGVEFASPTNASWDASVQSSAPKGMASRVAAKLLERGVLLLTTSIFEVVRFIPPLNISQADMAKGIKAFQEAVEEVVREG
ncbi:aminotransferase class-III protein [Rhizoctonia solani]|uniref:Aminotransferase class-III protein n=1 Tax=Rhizoctonia solani TaxID=456999 RepID=A0A8H8P0G0_9AGAM|nr:aminotransferase class-III protein [Rhizoctonia solani]QRW21608.1 aminotransferase class-III protein [Rhizoctonia solani]